MCTEMKTNATVVFFDIEFCASDIFHTNVTPVLVQLLGRISGLLCIITYVAIMSCCR